MNRAPGVQLSLHDPGFRLGLLAGLGAFLFWGFVPVYFKFLESVSPLVVVAYRIIFSVIFLAAVLLWRNRSKLPASLAVGWKNLAMLGLSATFLAANWLVFVWAVSNEQILATSLGYYINPLVSVLLGFLFLGERLSRAQWTAVAIAASATTYLGFAVGEPPWPALTLAFSFGTYGLIRKTLTSVLPLVGLLWEALLLLPPALVYLFLMVPGLGWEGSTPEIRWLLVGSGLVTILPLFGFNFAAQRLPLAILGFMQYLAPTISFMVAVFVFREPFSTAHGIAFAGIWAALIIFSISGLRGVMRLQAQPAR
ncbi:MAG: EamA family transporter RarD [Xanthomonadales bacterium]|nr:EamA family transporter RarD [Xanthomonadales bacterium]